MRIALFGSSGAIGGAFLTALSQDSDNVIYAPIRGERPSDATSAGNVRFLPLATEGNGNIQEAALAEAAEIIKAEGSLDWVIVAVGVLHGDGLFPEKSLRDLNADQWMAVHYTNTVLPVLIGKHFLNLLNKDKPSVFAALSARVGSISDNRLGGWYAYRASKAALNMFIRTASIEMGRKNKNAIVIGLHPGTVASKLSEPFQARVPEHKLFSPEYSVGKLLEVIKARTVEDSGRVFAWDGERIPC